MIGEKIAEGTLGEFKMGEEGILEKSNAVFANLIALTNEELNSQGFTVPANIIIEKIVSPVKALYIKNLTQLFESLLRAK